ncbi:hypothetical protein RvY_13938-2 [Ramazzottius varieornatus]|uniref:Uncharacterized protein n=1 Tax=Ramazzottius varieornatus TaxID=947166 RepID=A0A1D1VPL8_RAMVA|nr:hypothetical protein RvY_13938-2 [Ramazzottius varieornatus]
MDHGGEDGRMVAKSACHQCDLRYTVMMSCHRGISIKPQQINWYLSTLHNGPPEVDCISTRIQILDFETVRSLLCTRSFCCRKWTRSCFRRKRRSRLRGKCRKSCPAWSRTTWRTRKATKSAKWIH